MQAHRGILEEIRQQLLTAAQLFLRSPLLGDVQYDIHRPDESALLVMDLAGESLGRSR
jgi:hypothetical protein